jgi:hypothetical protein
MRWIAAPWILLATTFLCGATAGEAQTRRPLQSLPLAVRVSVPTGASQTGREPPQVTTSGVLSQLAGGAAGGAAGLLAVGLPMFIAGQSGLERPSDAVIAGLLGSGFLAGSTLGIHAMGRREEMSGSAWATGAGVLAGMGVVAALRLPLISDDEDYRQPNLPLLLPPAAGGTAGFLLTRRAR